MNSRTQPISPVAPNEDAAMAAYASSRAGREAIAKGLADVADGKTFEGRGSLGAELTRRAEERRRKS